MIQTKIRCKQCDTVLDTEVLKVEERQQSCKCDEIFLDWHGHRVGAKDFRNVDAMGDEKEQAKYNKLADFYKAAGVLAVQYEAGELTQDEWNAAHIKLEKETFDDK